jgi:hypothetical protein
LQWKVPDVTLTNSVTLSNKVLLNASIADSGISFAAPVGNSFTVTLLTVTPTANRTITLPDATTTLVGTDTQQTLTNKSISANQITGQLSIQNGGTGADEPAVARGNLEIFNGQQEATRTPYSGKIFVADPTLVGPNGETLQGANQGDLWFW